MVGAKFCYLELLVFMVLLPGVSCSPMPRCHPTNLIEYRMTIESMTRQHKAKRFLLMTENLSGEFNLSFTGGDRAPGTGESTFTTFTSFLTAVTLCNAIHYNWHWPHKSMSMSSYAYYSWRSQTFSCSLPIISRLKHCDAIDHPSEETSGAYSWLTFAE